MRAHREKMVELMDRFCDGNYTRFGKELGVDPSHVHRYIKTGVGGGKKIVGSIIKFCKDKGLDFEEYVEL